jgi:LmbE family N-acetylglucosaminyl deacetylase
MIRRKKILFIGAHFDDLEIACGGAIQFFLNKKYDVSIYVITNSQIIDLNTKKIIRKKSKSKKEFLKSCKILGIKKFYLENLETNKLVFHDNLISKIRKMVEKISPDIVFCHWDKDVHQDHSAVGKSCLSACRHLDNLFMYRSNYYESTDILKENFYIDISNYFQNKIHAIKCYTSELKRVNYSWIEMVKNRDRLNGLKNHTEYAESFCCVKCLINKF